MLLSLVTTEDNIEEHQATVFGSELSEYFGV